MHIAGQDWDIRESGPPDAAATLLLLPGGLCTAAVFADIMDALADAPVRVVAATLPGFGRTAHPADLTIENYASLAAKLAAEVGADVVGGHSLGANVALEMAARGDFRGPLVLLSPSFSRVDEYKELRVLNAIARVPGVGALAWRAALKAMPKEAAKTVPPASRDAFAAILANNDPGLCRRVVRDYFAYLDRHDDLVARLRETGARTTVAFGDHDDVGLTATERAGLEAAPEVTLVTVADATHMLIVEQPARLAELILERVGVSAPA